MPYIVEFLDDELYRSLSFDADIKFQQGTEYAKKIWVLKKYKSQGGKVELTNSEIETENKKNAVNSYSSYSLSKSFKNNELVINGKLKK